MKRFPSLVPPFLALAIFVLLPLLAGCGKKIVSNSGGPVTLQVLCAALADKPGDPFPADLADLLVPVPAGSVEFFPAVQIQRVDLDPPPAPFTPVLDENFSAGLQKTLGTWDRTKQLRALRTQLSAQPVGPAFAKSAPGSPVPWGTALLAALGHADPDTVLALQPGVDPAAGYAFNGRTFPAFPDANSLRQHLGKILAARPAGGPHPAFTLVLLPPAAPPAATPAPAPRVIPRPTVAATTPPPAPPAQVALRLQGSNTIGAKLIGGLLEAFLAGEGWGNVTRVPGRDADEYALEGVVAGSVSRVTVSAHGSGTAFDGLGHDECDIGMASRRVKPAEQAALARLGDLTSASCEHVLGLDGLAIIVPKSNPVASLNRRQLQDLFSGRAADWGTVGGRPGPVHLYARDDQSGTFDTFKALVLETAPLAPGAKRFDDSNRLSDAVAADPAGIGFIGLPFVRSAKALAIAEVGAAPLVPTVFTVATEDYPLSRRLYLYTAASPANPLTLRFVEYALGTAGQEVVAKYGFVDQTVKKPKKEDLAVPALPRDALPPAYVAMTTGADRLAVNFRFRSGSSQLDNKAVDDLDRVTAYLASPAARGRQVLLLGFADNKGNEKMNQSLSDERAKIVARQFATRGVLAGESRGFGPTVPVGDNATDDGREKNRRVEVWVR